MAVKHTDLLSRILQDQSVSHRRDIWLWFWLIGRGVNLGSYAESRIGMRDTMANHLNQHAWLAKQARDDKNNQLLPDRQLEWLNEGNRQIEWIHPRFMQGAGYTWNNIPQGIFGRDRLILIIDLWRVDITQKKLILDNLKIQWNAHKSGDKAYKWFKDDDKKNVLAWEWLNKNTSFTVPYPKQFETYEDFLIFLDSANLTTEQKTLYIDKIKKRWSQQKYREGLTGKAQYNFVLSDKAIANLDKLASFHEISRAKILEVLLEMETEKNSYIPEKIRILKLLNNS